MQIIRDMQKKVIIIDYQLGNLFSVKQACDTVGIHAEISSNREDIINADALILPGVGAFIEAMKNLHKLNLVSAIKEKVKNGTPFFGICLGQQLIFTSSEEFGDERGLNLIPGEIKRFPNFIDNRKILVPHISWNKIYKSENQLNDTPLFDLSENDYMYFIHSYYVIPANNECVLTKTNYDDIEFCSSVIKDNIFSTQFHPEKSGDKGVLIYKKWATINKLL
jgi:imidazole glycerol-phosphate synthase subunit HisH